jgi:hypothetical protein
MSKNLFQSEVVPQFVDYIVSKEIKLVGMTK